MAGAGQGLIDGYRVTVTCSDGTKTEKYYPIQDAGTAQALNLNDLKAKSSKSEDVTFSVTVCEYLGEGDSRCFGPESGTAQSKPGEPADANTLNWFNGVWLAEGTAPGAGVSAFRIQIVNGTTLRFSAVDSATGAPFLNPGQDASYTMQTVERPFTYDAQNNRILCEDYPTANEHGGGYPPLLLTAHPGRSAEEDRLGFTWYPDNNSTAADEHAYLRHDNTAGYWAGTYTGNEVEYYEARDETTTYTESYDLGLNENGELIFYWWGAVSFKLNYDPATKTATGQTDDGRYRVVCAFSETDGVKHLHVESVSPGASGVFDGKQQ